MTMLYRKITSYIEDYLKSVISNEREVYQEGRVTYMPVYFVMFMEIDSPKLDESEYIF